MRSDVTIVLKRAGETFDVVGEICERAGTVHDVYPDLGVIEATLGAEHVGPLHKLPGVSYVRAHLTYADVS